MKFVKCSVHELEVVIPSTDEEYASGAYHDQITLCVEHHKEYPTCKFSKNGGMN